MRKFLIKISLVLIIFGALNFLYLLLIQKTDWNFKKRIESKSFSNPSFKLLIIGNSLAMNGFDAELITEYGISAYNLAIAGASIKTSYLQLEEYVKCYPIKPKFVVLGVGSYLNYFESDYIHPIVEYTLDSKKFTLKDLPLLRFKWLFLEFLKKIVSKQHREANLVLGQLRFEKTGVDTTSFNYNNKFPFDFFYSNNHISSIIDLCNKHSIKLFIVEMPGYKDVRHPNSVNSFPIDSTFENGIIVDMNTVIDASIFNDKQDWVWSHHLNVNGSRKFTKAFIKKMEPIIF